LKKRISAVSVDAGVGVGDGVRAGVGAGVGVGDGAGTSAGVGVGVGIEEGGVGSVGCEEGEQAPTNRDNAVTALSKTQSLYFLISMTLACLICPQKVYTF